jgi:hypothetical protein
MMGAATLHQAEPLSILLSENLSAGQVSELLAVSKHDLARWRVKREGPPFMLLRGGTPVYPTDRFMAWMRASRRAGRILNNASRKASRI